MQTRSIRQAIITLPRFADPLRADIGAGQAVDQLKALKQPGPAVRYQFRIHYYCSASLILWQGLSEGERADLRDDCRDLMALGHRPEDLHTRDLPARWYLRFAALRKGAYLSISEEEFCEALAEAAFDAASAKPRKSA